MNRSAMNRFFIASVLFLFASCSGFVPMDDSELLPPQKTDSAIPGPDPGASLPLRTMNFVIEGYGATPQSVSGLVERIYADIIETTALLAFRPKENYRVVIYASAEEFRRKTKQPAWSGGMKYANGVYTFEQSALAAVLAHEISHLVFSDFFSSQTVPKTRWLNEGLAMNIETRFSPGLDSGGMRSLWAAQIRSSTVMPLEKIISFEPYSEEARAVDLWYAHAASLTGYVIHSGGAFGFSVFLGALRDGGNLDEAFSRAYPGTFRNLEDLYRSWKSEQQLR